MTVLVVGWFFRSGAFWCCTGLGEGVEWAGTGLAGSLGENGTLVLLRCCGYGWMQMGVFDSGLSFPFLGESHEGF